MDVKQLLQQKEGTIIDVRTPAEYLMGCAVDSVNIPLQEVMDRMDEIKALQTPLILCCASGGRSGQATAYLSSLGIECVNAGSWLDVNYLQAQINKN
jgi:rhodanese-related sulfurtransferase